MEQPIYNEVLGNAPFLREAVLKFLKLLPERVQEMQGALREGRFDDLRAVAHRMKGAGGTHGYPAVSECAREIAAAASAGERRRVEALVREFAAFPLRLVAEPPPRE